MSMTLPQALQRIACRRWWEAVDHHAGLLLVVAASALILVGAWLVVASFRPSSGRRG